MRTVTFDETQFAIVPIDPAVALQIGWAYVDAAREASPEKDWAFSHVGYKAMIAAAPPYPESNFVESLDSWIPVSARLPDTSRKVIAHYKNECGKDRQVMAFHAGKFDVESNSDDEYMDYCEGDDTYYLSEGWHEVIENWEAYSSVTIDYKITHWKELDAYPAAPKEPE